MKFFITTVAFFLICMCTIAQTKLFKGSMFDVKYPTKFKILNCPKPSSCDGATFESPDKLVSFYVYSPQWNGLPDVDLKENEKINNTKTTEKKDGDEVETVTIETTISAKNGSYTRSFIDVENKKFNTRKTFSIKYKNLAAYNKYKIQFIAFKKSLVQYGD